MKSFKVISFLFLVSLFSACMLLDVKQSKKDWRSYASSHGYKVEDSGYFEVLPPFPLIMNSPVQDEINYFMFNDPGAFSEGLNRRRELMFTIRDIFRHYGIPYQVLNVALIESTFRPDAKSPAGAVGLWQFMKGTAHEYGLKVGYVRDERLDPILSTIAAAKLLRNLYLDHKDWYLALAAYNSGSGRVKSAIRKSGSKNFWILVREENLPKETARFVPKVIAASIIERNPSKYGFKKRYLKKN